MGGNSRFHKKASMSSSAPTSSFSFFGFFKPSRRSARCRDDSWAEDAMSPRKNWTSDYDKGKYVAEPGIDRKASAFIAKFHESRVSESERQTIAV